MRSTLMMLAVVATLLVPRMAGAQNCVLRVSLSGDGSDGLSWSTAFDDIRDAVDEAAAQSEPCWLWVAGGQYVVDALEGPLVLPENLAIYGGFAGTEDELEQRDPWTNVVYINGQTTVTHVLWGADGVQLDGLVIMGGAAVETGDDGRGGGVFVPAGAWMLVDDCIFFYNEARSGGAIYAHDADLDVVDSLFLMNHAWNAGGAVASSVSETTVTRTRMRLNMAGNLGGAMIGFGGNLTLQGADVRGNWAGTAGGGIYVGSGTDLGTLSVTDSVFLRNMAGTYGGAVALNLALIEADVELTSTLLAQNVAGAFGGAVLLWAPADIDAHETHMSSCTFADNSVLAGGGEAVTSFGVAATVVNAIIAGNLSPLHTGSEGTIDVSWSFVDFPWTGDGIHFGTDPGFIDPSNDNYHLRPDSPCVDTALGTATLPSIDGDGFARFDLPWVTNTGMGTITYGDRGAYEYRSHMVGKLVDDPEALCLNGEPADYYVYPGWGVHANKWIVYLQGGGYCLDPDTCHKRNLDQIGPLADSVIALRDGGTSGILSDDPLENPKFNGFNKVYVHYCSSDLYTGHGADGLGNGEVTFIPKGGDTAITGEYRGYHILRAVFTELIDSDVMTSLGMPVITDAERVLVGGSSAGGIGAMTHLDRITNAFTILSSAATVEGFNDAGFVMDFGDPADTTSLYSICGASTQPLHYSNHLDDAIVAWNGTASLDQTCNAAMALDPLHGPEACLIGEVAYDWIDTPMFVQMSQQDTSVGGLKLFAGNATCIDAISSRIHDVMSTAVTAGFSPDQPVHGIMHHHYYDDITIGPYQVDDVMWNWFSGAPTGTHVVE